MRTKNLVCSLDDIIVLIYSKNWQNLPRQKELLILQCFLCAVTGTNRQMHMYLT